ncbi:RNA polymerase sigma factor FliA [Oleiagrimonas citrea]|uniref:Sigma-70 family RNA polymerase sigma factor n=1 Tax=Oleiagrimonas citrea TaxID=1665687 RepID=A0A846ZLG1_9GAMM|nr:sigma-70 family RNA polymerase sigma factor [Oleiagrimonas citrea]NKZ39034.1 sigma-70 family RNA polymerase sigma factor [Oleiagrimonas citrea]
MEQEERQLWEQWIADRDIEARNALVVYHADWSRLVARDVLVRVRVAQADWADFVQNATIGLIEAVERFDPGMGVSFRSYARHRVRGAVFDGLKDLRSAAYRPYQPKSAQVLGDRVQSLTEGETEDDPVDAFVRLTISLGIGVLLNSDSIPQEAEGTPYTHAERSQMRSMASDAIARLPVRQRDIVRLHYFQHMPFVDIAEMYGVSKGRISQLHRQALDRLRDALRVKREALAC